MVNRQPTLKRELVMVRPLRVDDFDHPEQCAAAIRRHLQAGQVAHHERSQA
jgi:hypothetical protein